MLHFLSRELLEEKKSRAKPGKREGHPFHACSVLVVLLFFGPRTSRGEEMQTRKSCPLDQKTIRLYSGKKGFAPEIDFWENTTFISRYSQTQNGLFWKSRTCVGLCSGIRGKGLRSRTQSSKK